VPASALGPEARANARRRGDAETRAMGRRGARASTARIAM
jgi:hypothetical protein